MQSGFKWVRLKMFKFTGPWNNIHVSLASNMSFVLMVAFKQYHARQYGVFSIPFLWYHAVPHGICSVIDRHAVSSTYITKLIEKVLTCMELSLFELLRSIQLVVSGYMKLLCSTYCAANRPGNGDHCEQFGASTNVMSSCCRSLMRYQKSDHLLSFPHSGLILKIWYIIWSYRLWRVKATCCFSYDETPAIYKKYFLKDRNHFMISDVVFSSCILSSTAFYIAIVIFSLLFLSNSIYSGSWRRWLSTW
jgi:hypothetical protein